MIDDELRTTIEELAEADLIAVVLREDVLGGDFGDRKRATLMVYGIAGAGVFFLCFEEGKAQGLILRL